MSAASPASGSIDPRCVSAHLFSPARYPAAPPFHPARRPPESLFEETSEEPNDVYEGVRACFRLAGLDAANQGTARWNPLAGLVLPGETVLIKPNLIKESHPRYADGWRCVLTHGSIIRAVADYVFRALDGRGRVVVADAPQTDSSFDAIRRVLGLDALTAFYRSRGLNFDVLDLRKEEWTFRGGAVVARRTLSGDPAGYLAIDLGAGSEFAGHGGEGRYYGADYDRAGLDLHHSQGRHEYLVSATAMAADVIFSLPKLKTHKKAGITVSLKNLVGINGDKNWLPHHTEAGAGDPGDERPFPDARGRVERSAVRTLQRAALRGGRPGAWFLGAARGAGRHLFGGTGDTVRSGNWWGNDTVWRMCLDLNKIALYGNPDGSLRPPGPPSRRRHLVLVDGVVAGEGRGPLDPDPVPCGLLVFGTHPASTDAACAVLMGFDPELIPLVRGAFRCRERPLAEWNWRDVRLISDRSSLCGNLDALPPDVGFRFVPHFGWRGHIERSSAPGAQAG